VATFCDADGGGWGALVGGAQPLLALGELTGAGTELIERAQIVLAGGADGRPAGDDGEWQVTSEHAELRIAPVEGAVIGQDGLIRCRATGTLTFADTIRPVEAEAVRCARSPLSGAGSVRLLSGWFPSDRAVALLACRPGDSLRHDEDTMLVALRGERDGLLAFDPRLSTTYSADLRPLRVGAEMWLGEDEEGDLFPMRMAGQRRGTGARAEDAGARIDACALRCQSRDAEGFGVYLLVAAE
jgi:hypothetical protein